MWTVEEREKGVNLIEILRSDARKVEAMCDMEEKKKGEREESRSSRCIHGDFWERKGENWEDSVRSRSLQFITLSFGSSHLFFTRFSF